MQDINWEKMRYMANKLGLTAWHADAPNKVLVSEDEKTPRF